MLQWTAIQVGKCGDADDSKVDQLYAQREQALEEYKFLVPSKCELLFFLKKICLAVCFLPNTS